MAHDRFRRFNTMGRWPNQSIDYDVSLMVRATGRSLFIAGLTGSISTAPSTARATWRRKPTRR